MTPEVKTELIKWGLYTILPAVVTWLVGRLTPALPAKARKWLKEIGGEKEVLEFIDTAADFAQMTEAEKREWVADELASRGVPDSIANLLVEWAYQRFKAGK